MTKVADMLVRVERRLNLMSGPGIQISGEDAIVEHLTSAYHNYIDDYWWDEQMIWASATLDGVNGDHSLDFLQEGVRRLEYIRDLRYVIPEQSDNIPINRPPAPIYPSQVTGDKALFYVPYADPAKMFRILPYTALGTINIYYRWREQNIDLDSELLLDEELLVAAATYLYLADDGTNPGATAVAAERLKERERQMRESHSHIIQAQSSVPGPVDYWWQS